MRAIAVLLVFIFHSWPGSLTGGFIGVDVFFVLSGYLITLILLRHRSPRTLGSFYVRRIKRLLPAALVLLGAVAVRESIWGPVTDLDARFAEIRATTLYVANWHLISRSDDYFAEWESVSPLRHMWSLAVEEQFYVVWPLLLLLVVWLSRRALGAAAAAAALLATASAITMYLRYSPADVARAYYGTDARVFQPLLGATLAIGTVWYAEQRRRTGDSGRRSASAPVAALVVGVAALAILGVMAFRLDGTEAAYFHLGAVAVAVVAGVLIWALERSQQLAAVVGWFPLAALGKISYGVYLWHWPIIVWLRPREGSFWLDGGVVHLTHFVLTIAIATVSYWLIERPIRMLRVRGPGFQVFGVAAVAMAMVIGGSSWLLREPEVGREAIAASAADDLSVEHCPDQPHPCVLHEPADPAAPTVALVGDSTAQMYVAGLRVLAEQYGFRLVQEAMGGCPIGDRLLATGIQGELHRPHNFMCYDAIPANYQEMITTWQVDLVIATAWNDSNKHITNGELVDVGTDRHRAEMQTALWGALDVITSQGARAVFLTLLPPGPFLQCLEQNPPNEGNCQRVIIPSQIDAVNEAYRQLDEQREDAVGVIDLLDVVCPGGEICPLTIDDVVVRYDGTHFTGTFSRGLAPVLDQRLRDLGIDLSSL